MRAHVLSKAGTIDCLEIWELTWKYLVILQCRGSQEWQLGALGQSCVHDCPSRVGYTES